VLAHWQPSLSTVACALGSYSQPMRLAPILGLCVACVLGALCRVYVWE
jgi:hypothetical protein